MTTVYEWKRVTRANVFVFVLLILSSITAAQELSELSDDQLIDQYHRAAYRQELLRRESGYTQAERDAIRAKLFDKSTKRHFPVQYTEDELFECALDGEDPNPGHIALFELKKRYESATQDKLVVLVERFRTAYRATPFPKLLPDMSNARESSANLSIYSALDNAARHLLPEADALALFREIYLESGQPGAVGEFLLRLQGEPFLGSATQAVLEELNARYKDVDEASLHSAGEAYEIKAIIGQKLRRFATPSFEVLKAREWKRNRLDIIAMGRSDNPEARELLESHYGSLSKAWLATESRLDVLRALVDVWNRNPDSELQQLLREELTEIAGMDHSANLHYLERTAEVVRETGDPYYIPVLKKCRAEINPAAIREASLVPDDMREDDIEATFRELDKTIRALETAQRVQP